MLYINDKAPQTCTYTHFCHLSIA